MKRNCRLLKHEKERSQKQKDDNNTTAIASNDDGGVTLVLNQEECYYIADANTEWIVDSIASFHCVPRTEHFATYKAGDFDNIKMGNTSISHIVWIGDISIKTNVRSTLTLQDVRHIPDL